MLVNVTFIIHVRVQIIWGLPKVNETKNANFIPFNSKKIMKMTVYDMCCCLSVKHVKVRFIRAGAHLISSLIIVIMSLLNSIILIV